MSIDRDGKITRMPGAIRPVAVVLDTNTVLDWLVFQEPAAQPLAEALDAGHLTWLACAHMHNELEQVLSLPALARYRPDAAVVLARFDGQARRCAPPPPARSLVCTDRDDQVFVDLACAEGARWLITRDRALLALARRAARAPQALGIVTPARWAATAAAAAAAAAVSSA